MSDFLRILELPKGNSFFLFGPRSTGKSTLIRASFKAEETLYFNLLKQSDFMRLSKDFSAFEKEVKGRAKEIKYVVVDEIQLIPWLLNTVHDLIESPNPPIFILSGSSARKLRRQGANMLGGRAWNLKLFPLTSKEIGENFDLDKAVNYGTLPSSYLADKETAIRFLKTYEETYINEEIKEEALSRNLGTFLKFLEIAASENTGIVNFSNLAKISYSKNTEIKEYYQILEDTLLGFFLFPYINNTRKRLTKHPRFYFFDNGVARVLAGKLGAELIKGSKEYGHAFEAWLINEIKALDHYYQKFFKFYFYRTNAGAEVDLIIKTPQGEILAIEIKSHPNPGLKELAGLYSFLEIEPKAKLICACTCPRPYTHRDVQIMPWQDLLKLLFK